MKLLILVKHMYSLAYELNNIMFSLSDYIFKNNIDSLIMIYSVEFITFEKKLIKYKFYGSFKIY